MSNFKHLAIIAALSMGATIAAAQTPGITLTPAKAVPATSAQGAAPQTAGTPSLSITPVAATNAAAPNISITPVTAQQNVAPSGLTVTPGPITATPVPAPQKSELTVGKDGQVSVSGAPGLTVTPVTTPQSAPAAPVTREQMRPELQNYATAMDWSAWIVVAVALAFAFFLKFRTQKKEAVAEAKAISEPKSALKMAREKTKAEKAARKIAANKVDA
jgi:hypothetical protein